MSDVLAPGRQAAEAAWAARVRANRDQAERVREGQPPPDFYAPVARQFAPTPPSADDPVLAAVEELVVAGETWLDIGAGGGRVALPLARRAGRVVAVEPSAAMADQLDSAIAAGGVTNIDVVRATWPEAAGSLAADVAFMSHVGYDIEAIGPFLDAMEAAASRLCVAVMLTTAPASRAAALWPPVHGEERDLLPALPEFLALLLARGRTFEVRLRRRDRVHPHDAATARAWWFQQLFVNPASDKGQLLDRLLTAGMGDSPGGPEETVGVVTWAPA